MHSAGCFEAVFTSNESLIIKSLNETSNYFCLSFTVFNERLLSKN